MDCRACGGRRVELVLNLGDQPHCNRLVRPDLPPGEEPAYPLRVGFCLDCTMVQIDHTIPKESMFSDYPYVSGTTTTLPEHFRETSARIAAAYGLGEQDLVVDIGSNDGTWLKQYAPYGCRVLGIEAAANVAGIAQAAGIPTWNRFFNEDCAGDILAECGPAKIVTAAGVFFHLEELHSVVRGIASLLAPNGVFVVQAIYLGGMVENTAFDQVYHEHLCYYTLRSLSALLERHGLEVFEANLVPIHGGSIEAHVARKGTRPIGQSVRRLQADESAKQLGDIATYRQFAERVLALRDRLRGLLSEYRARGRSVWAYGAPAKGATLLNSFGIGPDLVQKAVEKNRLKIGLAIPGVRIPIEDEVGQRPDAYLVLAWNFIDEFVRKEQAWLRSGGEFIVPIPEVKVIGANQSA
ncbi:MAG TPA: class I SAM-dependent methyltransferase [Acetobacteraceae bacterium]|jgi:2-polyprenyl-3-methyl-5-hydroxy-6-metoxy-1,4-benzoquinol methylase|nr:class I SAM-dependent methyltransferase [Acetobacteraceae bacterium]